MVYAGMPLITGSYCLLASCVRIFTVDNKIHMAAFYSTSTKSCLYIFQRYYIVYKLCPLSPVPSERLSWQGSLGDGLWNNLKVTKLWSTNLRTFLLIRDHVGIRVEAFRHLVANDVYKLLKHRLNIYVILGRRFEELQTYNGSQDSVYTA